MALDTHIKQYIFEERKKEIKNWLRNDKNRNRVFMEKINSIEKVKTSMSEFLGIDHLENSIVDFFIACCNYIYDNSLCGIKKFLNDYTDMPIQDSIDHLFKRKLIGIPIQNALKKYHTDESYSNFISVYRDLVGDRFN